MVTKTAVAPLERTKVLFQLQGRGALSGPPRYLSVPQTLRLIWSEEGLIGWYKGNGANCFRIVPVYALKFGFNDYVSATRTSDGSLLTTHIRSCPAAQFKLMLQSHDAAGKAQPLSLAGLVAAGSMSGLLQCCEAP